ncbi:MAG: hypothetical protein LBC61_06940 [Candidatus Peribacteria bacterium]|nr:hypothetical protein [Candidatus Peribacteria bacterium]
MDDITGFSKVFTLKLEDLLTRYNNASDAIKNDAKNDLNELSKVVSKRPKALDLSTPNKSTASYSRVREKHSMFENDTIILEGLDVTKLKELDEEKDDLKFVKALKEIGIFVKTVGEEFYRENYDQNEIDNLRKVIDGLLIKK